MRQAPGGAAVLGVEDDGVYANGPAALRVDEADAEESALHRGRLLVPGESAVGARRDHAEPANEPDVVWIGVADSVEIDVAGLDTRIEGGVGQLHVLGDPARGPGRAAVLRVHHGAEVACAVPALRVRELQDEEVAVRARLHERPGGTPVSRGIDDSLLAGDPGSLGIEARDREERALGAGVLPLPGGSAVIGAEDPAQLADHPSLLISREAGREEILPDLAEIDGLGPGDRRAGDHERGDEELHADPS